MKNKIIVIIVVCLLLSSANFLNNQRNDNNMNRFLETAKTIKSVIRYSLFPVHSQDDVPQNFDPTKKSVLRNGTYQETIDGELTVASWNILRDYNKVKIRTSLTKILNEQNPQIILVQEAPIRNERGFWEDQLFTDFNVFYAPLHHVAVQDDYFDFSETGQLTLSRYPFTRTEVYPLPSVSGQFHGENHFVKRIALYTQIATDDKTIGIYNVHLENNCWQSGRKKQLEYLLEIIHQNNDDVVLIGGDFNTFLGGLERGISRLEKAGFEKLLSGFRLDHMLVRGSRATGSQLR